MRSGSQASSLVRSRGMSSLEVLVAVTVLSVLMAILVPAAMFARESSRRTTCANQLKQIGAALSAYESSHKAFPAASKAGFSPLTQLLPYLEQSALYDRIDFKWPYGKEVEDMLAEHRPGTFVCPSELSTSEPLRNHATSYVANVGTSYLGQDSDMPIRKRPDTGAFGRGVDLRMSVASFTDGLSNTAFYSEAAWWNGGGQGAVYLLPHKPTTVAEWRDNLTKCRSAADLKLETSAYGHAKSWYIPGLGSSAYVHVDPPNSNSCSFGGKVPASVYSASSRHASGVNVLFGDGRIQFVSDSVAGDVWRAIGTRNGAESAKLP